MPSYRRGLVCRAAAVRWRSWAAAAVNGGLRCAYPPSTRTRESRRTAASRAKSQLLLLPMRGPDYALEGPVTSAKQLSLGDPGRETRSSTPSESQSRSRLPEAAVMSGLVAQCCRGDSGRRGVARRAATRAAVNVLLLLDLRAVAAAPLQARILASCALPGSIHSPRCTPWLPPVPKIVYARMYVGASNATRRAVYVLFFTAESRHKDTLSSKTSSPRALAPCISHSHTISMAYDSPRHHQMLASHQLSLPLSLTIAIKHHQHGLIAVAGNVGNRLRSACGNPTEEEVPMHESS